MQLLSFGEVNILYALPAYSIIKYASIYGQMTLFNSLPPHPSIVFLYASLVLLGVTAHHFRGARFSSVSEMALYTQSRIVS